MQEKYVIAGILALGMLLGLAASTASTASTTALENQVDENVLTVTGSGEVQKEPNRVEIRLGVEVTRDTAEEARNDNANRTASVVKALEDLGLDDDQVETERYSIRPQKSYSREGPPKVTGYTAVNKIKVTSNDTSIAADVVDTAVKNGANDVDSVAFTLTEEARTAARERAISRAINEAESEALAAVSSIGLELKRPVNIEVGSTGYEPYRTRMEAASAGAPSPESGTPIRPGDVTVTAGVNVEYGYE